MAISEVKASGGSLSDISYYLAAAA